MKVTPGGSCRYESLKAQRGTNASVGIAASSLADNINPTRKFYGLAA
jgi:hypothetical protein